MFQNILRFKFVGLIPTDKYFEGNKPGFEQPSRMLPEVYDFRFDP
jgi:hypothetical protein